MGVERGRSLPRATVAYTVKREPDIARLLDRRSRLKHMPVRPASKRLVLLWLAAKFEHHRDYSEREVNGILDDSHTFGDHTRLRRELCDARLLGREPDGSRYWRLPSRHTKV